MGQDTGATVGHLPMENSRARVVPILTLTNYSVSPLVKGGLEILCRMEIYMSPAVKKKQLIDMYRNYVDLLYYEREIPNTVGLFIVREEKTPCGPLKYSEGNAEKNNTKLKSRHKDVRSFFIFQPKTSETKASETNFIELSDTGEG